MAALVRNALQQATILAQNDTHRLLYLLTPVETGSTSLSIVVGQMYLPKQKRCLQQTFDTVRVSEAALLCDKRLQADLLVRGKRRFK